MAFMRQTDPVFSARQNVIEACKELLQAERHLFDLARGIGSARECADCVQKHLLNAESFADELGSLDRNGEWTAEGLRIRQATKGAIRMLESGARPREVAQAIRAARKPCMKATRSFTLERTSHVRVAVADIIQRGKRLATKRNLTIAAAGLATAWFIKR